MKTQLKSEKKNAPNVPSPTALFSSKVNFTIAYRTFFDSKKWKVSFQNTNSYFTLYWWLFGSTKSGHFGTFFHFLALIRPIKSCENHICTSIPAFFPKKMTRIWPFFPFYPLLMAPLNLAILALFWNLFALIRYLKSTFLLLFGKIEGGHFGKSS